MNAGGSFQAARRVSRALRAGLPALLISIGVGDVRPGASLVAARQIDAQSFAQQAAQALAQGRLDDAETLAKAQPADDPAAVAVRARLLILRGRYAEAQALLEPAAAASATSDAALELALLLEKLGHRDKASQLFTAIVEGAPTSRRSGSYLRAARAARALGQFQEANTYFRIASGLAPDDPAINTAWGDLFLEKYNRPDAMKSYQTALRADAKWAPAHLGLARTVVDENPPAAREAAGRALAIDSTLVAAHLLLAELDLDDARRDAARAAIDKALAINPNSLEAHALVGAIANLEDRTADFEGAAAKALAINASYGEVYRVAGDHAARNYRFDEAVTLVRRALALDPDNLRAHADLGIHLLRTGDEPGAHQALERAFAADPYDVVTYNLLALFDSLEKFETIQDGDIIMRLHAEEAPVMREYAMPLAHEALRTLSEKYGFTPKGPILIEIFPKHDDFAVRNVGLPGMIGALGACFGRVVTMDSPRARPPGSFNWGATLWHELAHVITLQMSKQRVPRWLTEGLSVFEEKRARPEWGREMEIAFVQALIDDEVLKLRDLNSGFTRPETIALAYYQASLLVEHLIATHGEPAIHQLLRAFGDGLDTNAALKKIVGADLDGLQAGFDTMLEQKFGALQKALYVPEGGPPLGEGRLESLRLAAAANAGSYPVQLAFGRALAAAGDVDAAIRTLERAVALAPMATGKESARVALIEARLRKGDRPGAIRELEALLGYDHTDIESARRLAELAQEAQDEPRTWLAYERIVGVNPFEPGAHGALGRLALKRDAAAIAIREFRAALATGPVDRAGAHCDLGESYLLAGKPAEAKQQALAALEVAPSYERAQELLLRVIEGREH